MKKEAENIDFERIYVDHFSKMKRFAKAYVVAEDIAENIVQDVFMELWEKREVLSMPVNITAFLFTATKNRCVDHLRHSIMVRKTTDRMCEEQKQLLKMKFDSLEAFNQDILTEKNIETILTNAIDSLPEKCRQIFIKNRIEGKKQKDIADEMDISVNTVESQMAVAYKKLRVELKDYLPVLIFSMMKHFFSLIVLFQLFMFKPPNGG